MRRKVKNPSNDVEKIETFKEGDTIYTKMYGACVIEFIDHKNLSVMPGVTARDENGTLHFIAAKNIIVED